MCGICGTFNLDSPPGEIVSSTQQMIPLMSRRGPDDEGFWADDQCALGFRRLAILDLSPAGHQPMQSSDGRCILVFNGEVYNFREIKAELERMGIGFHSTGDAEVVLNALSVWGVEALKKFNGMFALAFYDKQAATLLLARDHAGIKPLYYLQNKSVVIFASQYDQIIRHPLAGNPSASANGLGLYLRFGFCPAPYGILEKTHMLEPGSWVEFQKDGPKRGGKFFEFPKDTRPLLPAQDALNQLDAAIAASVSRHLISDVPVGLFLSGGVDSPLVAAYSSAQSGSPLSAFTIAVQDPQMDESRDAQGFADEMRLQHTLRHIREQDALDLLDDVIQSCPEPSADFSIFPTHLVSKLAAENVKVVLSGDGGDELFWGYPSRFAVTMRILKYFQYPIPLRAGALVLRKIFNVGAATREIFQRDLGALYQKKHTLLPEGDLLRAFPNLPALPSDFDLFKYHGNKDDESAQWMRWNEFYLHLQRVLLKVDRASMYHSLEVRVPLLDKEVIHAASCVDWRLCLNLQTNQGKLLLRQLLSRKLKRQTSGKKGFTVPMHQWLLGPLRDLLYENVLEKTDFLGLPVKKQALRSVYARMQSGDTHIAWGLWMLLSLSLWQQKHLVPYRA